MTSAGLLLGPKKTVDADPELEDIGVQFEPKIWLLDSHRVRDATQNRNGGFASRFCGYSQDSSNPHRVLRLVNCHSRTEDAKVPSRRIAVFAPRPQVKHRRLHSLLPDSEWIVFFWLFGCLSLLRDRGRGGGRELGVGI